MNAPSITSVHLFRTLGASTLIALACSCGSQQDTSALQNAPPPGGDGTYVNEPYAKLADYGLVSIRNGSIVMADEVAPYEVNTPLFSDYATKVRGVFLPRGGSMTYHDNGLFDFPTGAVLIKSFGFSGDYRDPNSPITWIETRLLIRTPTGWKPTTYLWDGAQQSATRVPGGRTRNIDFTDSQGRAQHANYLVPGENQCPKCHGNDGVPQPIGLYAAQVNRAGAGTNANQLSAWKDKGLLTGAPASFDGAPRLPVWDDPNAGTVEQRARSYMQGNCAYCHDTGGEARPSGLFLTTEENDFTALGICKRPVAAGRATGNLTYDVVPGDPDASILVYRMNATEPSIAMPELGHSLVHTEGLSLVRAWVQGLSGTCPK